MLEHIGNKKRKSTSIATDVYTTNWFRNILAHPVFYTWTSLVLDYFFYTTNEFVGSNAMSKSQAINFFIYPYFGAVCSVSVPASIL